MKSRFRLCNFNCIVFFSNLVVAIMSLVNYTDIFSLLKCTSQSHSSTSKNENSQKTDHNTCCAYMNKSTQLYNKIIDTQFNHFDRQA